MWVGGSCPPCPLSPFASHHSRWSLSPALFSLLSIDAHTPTLPQSPSILAHPCWRGRLLQCHAAPSLLVGGTLRVVLLLYMTGPREPWSNNSQQLVCEATALDRSCGSRAAQHLGSDSRVCILGACLRVCLSVQKCLLHVWFVQPAQPARTSLAGRTLQQFSHQQAKFQSAWS